MSEHRCSQCETIYTPDEYVELERVPINPDEENPKEGQGLEVVCECGARFYSDKWSRRETVDTADGEVSVSTVALNIPHGMDHDQWFETYLFHDWGSGVVRRYETESEAEDGHEAIIEQLENEQFEFVPTGKRLELEDTNGSS